MLQLPDPSHLAIYWHSWNLSIQTQLTHPDWQFMHCPLWYRCNVQFFFFNLVFVITLFSCQPFCFTLDLLFTAPHQIFTTSPPATLHLSDSSKSFSTTTFVTINCFNWFLSPGLCLPFGSPKNCTSTVFCTTMLYRHVSTLTQNVKPNTGSGIIFFLQPPQLLWYACKGEVSNLQLHQ